MGSETSLAGTCPQPLAPQHRARGREGSEAGVMTASLVPTSPLASSGPVPAPCTCPEPPRVVGLLPQTRHLQLILNTAGISVFSAMIFSLAHPSFSLKGRRFLSHMHRPCTVDQAKLWARGGGWPQEGPEPGGIGAQLVTQALAALTVTSRATGDQAGQATRGQTE